MKRKKKSILWLWFIGGLTVSILIWCAYYAIVTDGNMTEATEFIADCIAIIGSLGILFDVGVLYVIGFENGKHKAINNLPMD